MELILFVIGFLLGFGVSHMRNNPDDWADVKTLFKRK